MAKSKKIKNDLLEQQAQEVLINSFFSMVLALGIITLVCYLLSFVKEPLDVASIKSTYDLPVSDFIPEKHELMQYVFSVFLFPVLYSVFYFLFSKKTRAKSGILANSVEGIQTVFLLGVAIFIFLVFPKTDLQMLFTIPTLIFLVMVYLYMRSKGMLNKILTKTIFFIEILVVLFVSWLYITFNYFINNTVWHMDAYYYPVFEVFQGKTLMVDFNSLYGFYPYIIAPILGIFGNISMFSFSIFISVLVLIVFMSIFIVLWRNIKNKVLTLVALLAIVVNANVLYAFDAGYYLQYNPHRMLGPTLILLIFTLFNTARSPKTKMILRNLGFAVGAFAMFWNIDSGIIVVFAWALILIYQFALEFKLNDKRLYFQSFKVLGLSFVSILFAFLTLTLITFARSGTILNFVDVISGQLLFLGSGFYMLPMTIPNQWMVVVLVYAIGLVKSIRELAFLKKSGEAPNAKASIYFMLSILGLGLFSYYQGRSHEQVLHLVLWPCFILVCLLIDDYLYAIFERFGQIKSKLQRYVMLKRVVATVLMTALLCAYASSFTVQTIYGQSVKNFAMNTTYPIPEGTKQIIDFFKTNTKGNEEIYIITQYFEEYYTMLGIKNPMKIRSFIDWFTKKDYQDALDLIATTKNKVFIDAYIAGLISYYEPGKLEKILRDRFRLVTTFREISLFEVK